MYRRALEYRIECNTAKTLDDENIVDFVGQCGFLRADRLVDSPGLVGNGSRYKVIPVTAKHNMKADLGRELLQIKIFSPLLNTRKRVKFPEIGLSALEQPLVLTGLGGWDDDKVLPFGWDFTFGDAIETPGNGFTSKLTSFEVVRHDFMIEKGQKVGICVWRSDDRIYNDIEGTSGKMSEEEEKKFYGPAKVPVIQTGEVTGVYGNHKEVFAHNINTYEGCSGAVIFLLDKDQPPESVEEEGGDYGRAIGIHAAGYAPHNLGMSVIKAYHRCTNTDLDCISAN